MPVNIFMTWSPWKILCLEMKQGKIRESMVQDLLIFTIFYFSFPLVRQKAKEIIEFLQDDERLRSERRKAKQTRDKFVGYSSDEVTGRYSKLLMIYSC